MRNLVTLVFAFTLSASAQLGIIHIDQLPNTTEVRDAVTDITEMEGMVSSWHQKWDYATPQKTVIKRLDHDIKNLRDAVKQTPNNAELKLLLGLAAHFAYNLDMKDSFELSVGSFESAMVALPKDARPETLLGIHLCSTLKAPVGMEHLLNVEAKFSNLPDDFWRDEMLCGMMTSMPSHALMASQRAHLSPEDAPLGQEAAKRFLPASKSLKYASEDAWSAEGSGTKVIFTSRLCGISFTVPNTKQTQIPDVENGTCAAMFSTENFPGAVQTHSSATYMLLLQPQSEIGSMENFKKKMLSPDKHGLPQPLANFPCGLPRCEAFEVRDPSMYSEQDGGHMIALFAESAPPKIAGLHLETPKALPSSTDGKSGMTFLRANQVYTRLAEPMFVIVMMDASENIFSRAEPGFKDFVRGIVLDTD